MISITLESVSRVDIEDEWNFSNDTEFTMHSIHTYPAKFPAFIAKKAFDYAKAEGVNIKKNSLKSTVCSELTRMMLFLQMEI